MAALENLASRLNDDDLLRLYNEWDVIENNADAVIDGTLYEKLVNMYCDTLEHGVGLNSGSAILAAENICKNHLLKETARRWADILQSGDERTLVVFDFDTGDTECRYYPVTVIVYGRHDDIDSLEDSMASYIDSEGPEDASIEDAVRDVMNASGLRWELVECNVPYCAAMRVIHI